MKHLFKPGKKYKSISGTIYTVSRRTKHRITLLMSGVTLPITRAIKNDEHGEFVKICNAKFVTLHARDKEEKDG